MVRDQMVAKEFERLDGRIEVVEELEVFLGDRAPLRHGLKLQDLIPVLSSVEDDADLLRQLVGLGERENLEQLVERAEAAGKNDERLRQVCEPELSHEEVVELEAQPVRDVRVGALLERQTDVEADR